MLEQSKIQRFINQPYGHEKQTLLHTLAALRPPPIQDTHTVLHLGGAVDRANRGGAQPLHLALGWSDTFRANVLVPRLMRLVEADREQLSNATLVLPEEDVWVEMGGHSGLLDGLLGRLYSSATLASFPDTLAVARASYVQAMEGLQDPASARMVGLLLAAGANPLQTIGWASGRTKGQGAPLGHPWFRQSPLALADPLSMAVAGGNLACSKIVGTAVQRRPGGLAALIRGLRLSLAIQTCELLHVHDAATQRRISKTLLARAWELAKSGDRPGQTTKAIMAALIGGRDEATMGHLLSVLERSDPPSVKAWLNETPEGTLSVLSQAIDAMLSEPVVRRLLQLGADVMALSGHGVHPPTPPVFCAAGAFSPELGELVFLLRLAKSPWRPHGYDGAMQDIQSDGKSKLVPRLRVLGSQKCSLALVELLVTHGADPTALHVYPFGKYAAAVSAVSNRFAPRIHAAADKPQNVLCLSLLDIAALLDRTDLASYLLGLSSVQGASDLIDTAAQRWECSPRMQQLLTG